MNKITRATMKVLPKRQHLGCDDLCERCTRAMDRLTEDLQPVVDAAMEAVAETFRSRLPGILEGEIPSYAMPDDIRVEIERALTDWVYEEVNKGRPVLKGSNLAKRLQINKRLAEEIDLDRHGAAVLRP